MFAYKINSAITRFSKKVTDRCLSINLLINLICKAAPVDLDAVEEHGVTGQEVLDTISDSEPQTHI